MIDLGQAGLQKVKKYSPPTTPQDPIQAFKDTLFSHGIEPNEIDTSGALVRVNIDKPNDKAGWYVFYMGDICGAAFGNWRTGLKETWSSKSRREMTDAERAEYQRMVAEAKIKRERLKAELQAKAKEKSAEIWGRTQDLTSHPYLSRKDVANHGLRQSFDDLVVPVKDENGDLHNLQFIKQDGVKKFLFGGRVEGCSFTILGDSNLFICEGYATGATIHKATGATVICAFNAGNLEPVAKKVRAACPNAPITIAADNDRFTTGNPGLKFAEKAARAITGKVVLPMFDGLPGAEDPEKKLSDFNDLEAVGGLEIVKKQVSIPGKMGRLLPQGPGATQFKGQVLSRPKPLEFIFKFNDQGLIPKGVVGVLTATGGTGKTFWLLSLAMAGASGGEWGPINAPRSFRTLVIVGEDTQDELQRRAWDVSKGNFPDKFYGLSVYGELGPLMRLEGGNPVLADTYYWLDETIAKHKGLELLILDPKSRFYGLDENSNSHATQWIQALESLSEKHNLTILFSHHTSKDTAGRISQSMSRGASAIVDGCRWQGGLVRMDESTARFYGIENPRDYILFDAPKSNYAADLPGTIIFKRGDGGVLEYAEPGKKRIEAIGKTLLELLRHDPVRYTRNELIRKPKGRDIVRDVKVDHPTLVRSRDIGLVIDRLITEGVVKVEFDNPGRNGKEILIVT